MKLAIWVSVFFTVSLQAATIGSDSVVTRFNSNQTLTPGTRIAGFAALAAGFTMSNAITTATFDSFFAVSGPTDFNYGTLTLNQDLVFNNIAAVQILGNIIGNYHNLEFVPSMTNIPSLGTSEACSVGYLTSISTVAQVNTVDWNLTTTLLVSAMNFTAGNNVVQIYSWNVNTLTLTPTVGILGTTLDSTNVNVVRWYPIADWIAIGTAGGHIYLYSVSNNATSVTLLNTITLGATNPVNDLSWYPSGAFLTAATSVAGAQVRVYPVSAAGVFGTVVTQSTTVAAQNTKQDSTGSFFVVGTANNPGGPELWVYSLTGATPTLALDSSFDVGSAITGLHWCRVNPNTNVIAAGTQTGSNDLQLYFHTTGNLSQILTVPQAVNVSAVQWAQNGICLAAGLLLNSTLGEVLQYTYDNVANVLTQNNTINTGATVNDVRWSVAGTYLTTGDSSPQIQINGLDSLLVSTTDIYFYNVNMFLNNDITLSSLKLTFTGQNIIDGRGNTLSLAPTFTLALHDQGSLLLRNITVDGVQGSNIAGLSDLTTFSLENATFVLSNDFTFSHGNLDILNNFVISGPTYAFNYTSPVVSTIRGGQYGTSPSAPYYYGSLIIDNNVTFNYAPLSNASNLLNFESQYSTLMLMSSVLSAQNLSLTNGTLRVDGQSILQGITNLTLGDNVSADNMSIEIMPAANLSLQGNVFYSNV